MNNIEILRRAVREYLATRHPTAHASAAIARMLPVHNLVDFAVDASDVDRALAFLQDLGQVKAFTNSLGSARAWCATAAGVLAHERKE